MSNRQVLVTESHLEDIADAIRSQNGSQVTYKPGEMAAAIEALEIPVLGTKTITSNDTYDPADDDLDGYSEVTVNVPNTYAASDEGKVVSNGELVEQTARSSDIVANGTYDTTENNSVTVNISGSATLVQKSITENGTYNPADDNADGYSGVTVNVSGGSASTDFSISDNLIPLMTGSTTPSGTASASSYLMSGFEPYKAFNRQEAQSSMQGGWLASSGDTAPYIAYEWATPQRIDMIVLHTANNGSTYTLTLYVEGLTDGDVWENMLASGNTVDVTFVNRTYGSGVGKEAIPTNGGSYKAFRIRGTESFYKGTNQSACTFSSIYAYSANCVLPGIGYYGIGAPVSDLGVVGNVYSDVVGKSIYQKDSNGWQLL